MVGGNFEYHGRTRVQNTKEDFMFCIRNKKIIGALLPTPEETFTILGQNKRTRLG